MIEIKVDATKALARFSRDGIPVAVRQRLRKILPDIGKRLGALVERRMATTLQSRKRLNVAQEMHESVNDLYVRVAVEWTGDQSKAKVPFWLEHGTAPHMIEAINAKALSFWWPKVGGMYGRSQVFFKRVHHPGFSAYNLLGDSMSEMQREIVPALQEAVTQGMRESG